MDSVVIYSRNPFDLRQIKEVLSTRWPVEETGHGGLVVSTPQSRVYLNPATEGDLCCDEYHGRYGAYRLFLDHSCGLDLVKSVVELLADDKDLTVNNEFGTVLPGHEYVARLRENPKWNWRE